MAHRVPNRSLEADDPPVTRVLSLSMMCDSLLVELPNCPRLSGHHEVTVSPQIRSGFAVEHGRGVLFDEFRERNLTMSTPIVEFLGESGAFPVSAMNRNLVAMNPTR